MKEEMDAEDPGCCGSGETKSKCYDAPEAPAFYPTAKEFVHPGRYIASIAEAVRPFGICKIVPPPSWKPQFMIDKNKFHFRTKVQQVNYLDGQSRLRLTFVENLCRFLAKQGTPLERLPVVNDKVLDLCRLFSQVRKRGGMIAVSQKKQWSEVARALNLKSGFGATIKQHYERILFCYELYKASEAEKKQAEEDTTGCDKKSTNSDGANNVKSEVEAGSVTIPPKETPVGAPGSKGKEKGLQANGRPAAATETMPSNGSSAAATETQSPRKAASPVGKEGENADKNKKTDAINSQGSGDGESKSAKRTSDGGAATEGDGSDSDSEFEFGYHDGNRYSLASYKAMADAWKAKLFGRGLGSISERDVEDKYWDVVLTPEEMVEVEYGSELHTTTHGSGFPTCGNTLNPLDQPYSSSAYCRSPWNLNNLNASTLLRHIRQDIPGILSPWVYVGMCMSSFCWHNEDHYLYSINYLWDGEPKQWYGCSGDDADAFEQAMQEYAPELFETQPDLLFQLVTMMSPSELEARGVRVCRMTQRAGEFMLTFPRAYHGGFNLGFNVAESCNFALTDWIPWGRASDLHYRKLCRPQVFSHPGFLVNLAEDDEDVATSLWLLPDLLRYYEEEAGRHQQLIVKGLVQNRAMDVKRGGILTTALLEETEDVSNEYLDGKRVCASRMERVNKSMQEIRRAKQESAVADECVVCKASTFFFQVLCPCSPQSAACVEHAEDLCSCPLSKKLVDVRFAAGEFEELIEEVRERAQQPSLWMDKAKSLLASGPQPCRAYQSVAAEADKLIESAVTSVAALQEHLREELKRGRSWAARAQEVLGSASLSSKEQKEEPEVDVSELEKLDQEGKTLQAVPEEKAEIEELVQQVRAWRARTREVLADAEAALEVLSGLLAEGKALGVRMPESKRVQTAWDLQSWLQVARPLLSSRAHIDQVEALVREANQKSLMAAEVQAMKHALEEANTIRFKLSKARERQTGLVALRQVFEKAEGGTFGGTVVEIPEVETTKERIRRCEDWSARAKQTLFESAERPALTLLEKLAEEYSCLGAYVEPHEALRSRLAEGLSWLRKTRRLVGDEMLVADTEGEGENGMAGDTAMPDVDDSGAAGAEGETPKKRVGPSTAVGAGNKKPKKAGPGSGAVLRLVSLDAVKELLEEEKKLRVCVPEAEALAKRVEEFAGWQRQVLEIVSSGSFAGGPARFTGLKEQGEKIGMELGETGAVLEEHIWRAQVVELLQAGEKDGQQLANLKEAGRSRGWESPELDAALEAEILRLREKGCFCRRVGVNGKLSGAICCKACAKTFHPECLCLKKNAANAAYTCADCDRKSRQRSHVELPQGWQHAMDALGRRVFLNGATGQVLCEPPPGTTVRTTPGLRPFEKNPCMSRGAPREMCQVCFQEDTDMVECAECGVRVHPSCYGEPAETARAALWLCKSCDYGVRAPECPLCPLVGGAVKPCQSGGWAHVVCATWVPEVFFEVPERMEPIGGLDRVPKDRRRIPCVVCKTKKGAIVQCGSGKCSVSWHPLCGMEGGMYMNLEEDENGDVQYVMRCEKHKPAEEEEDDALYCVCQQRYVEGEFMIECEACAGWFHPKCVRLSELEAEQVQNWKCPPCLGHPPATDPAPPLTAPAASVQQNPHVASLPLPLMAGAAPAMPPAVLPVNPLAASPYALASVPVAAAFASGIGSG